METLLKSVILFNGKDMTYAVVGMNYLPEQATAEISNLKKDNLPAFTIDQKKHFNSEKEVDAIVNSITNGKLTKQSL